MNNENRIERIVKLINNEYTITFGKYRFIFKIELDTKDVKDEFLLVSKSLKKIEHIYYNTTLDVNLFLNSISYNFFVFLKTLVVSLINRQVRKTKLLSIYYDKDEKTKDILFTLWLIMKNTNFSLKETFDLLKNPFLLRWITDSINRDIENENKKFEMLLAYTNPELYSEVKKKLGRNELDEDLKKKIEYIMKQKGRW